VKKISAAVGTKGYRIESTPKENGVVKAQDEKP